MHKVNVRAIFLNGCTVYVEAMLNLATQLTAVRPFMAA
jgi:hypothetical protein